MTWPSLAPFLVRWYPLRHAREALESVPQARRAAPLAPSPGAASSSGLRAEAACNLEPGEARERRRPQNKGTAPDASAHRVVSGGSTAFAPENVKS
ncbi:MAG: hypothetical protein GY854_23995 [Deltaproteobacteria bacterium]|nr:hypothetical protein [Deltaproteobacteria bacterium]